MDGNLDEGWKDGKVKGRKEGRKDEDLYKGRKDGKRMEG